MIIKVCGMRDAENIREVERLGIDMMGFICWPRSPRYVAEPPAYLPNCPRVGVFVDAPIDFIMQRAKAFGFSHIQLHGSETAAFCHEVRERTGCKVIKAKSIQTPSNSPLKGEDKSLGKESSLPLREGWGGSASLLLFDTQCPTAGGSGRKFSWDVLQGYRGELPFLLSGGIGPEDVGLLRQFRHPKWLGIDINSRFEVEPGIKDVAAISSFVASIRGCNYEL